jgi:glycerate 2-kinase
MSLNPHDLLQQMFLAAVQAAQPWQCIPAHLPSPPKGRTLVIGAGKASAEMARVLEQCWLGPLSGLVVTRYGYSAPCQHVEIVEAAHPVPDKSGLIAAKRLMDLVGGLTADDLVMSLISGGASALLPLPAEGLTLDDKQDINRQLLASGATISEMNCVRRHLSQIKGGRLAARCHPARVVNLLISDVPGDDPINIGSGPTVADPTSCADAIDIIDRYGIRLSGLARSHLESGEGESIKPGDARLSNVETKIITAPRISLQAAANVARSAGITPVILGDSIEGEARDVGKVMSAIAQYVQSSHEPASPPCVLLSGGETTVTVRGAGRGGRNVEFLLSLAIELSGRPDCFAMAADTDGVDGQEEIAGAFIGPDTLKRAWALGLRPREYLANNDAHTFFERLGDQVITGPTNTNVNDFRAIVIL